MMFAFVIVAQKNFVVRSFSDVVFFGGGSAWKGDRECLA